MSCEARALSTSAPNAASSSLAPAPPAMAMPWAYSQRRMQQCVTSPIQPSLLWGSGFTLFSVAHGMPFSPRVLALNCGFLYAYSVLQCPLEALQGRQSLLHNGFAGAVLGYVGVNSGMVGVPFYHMLPQQLLSMPQSVTGAVVYGGCGVLLGALGGKSL